VGQGIIPADYHPMADDLTDVQLSELMANLKLIIDSNVSKLPTHNDFIARHSAAALQ